MNKTKIINVINDLIEYQNNNCGISLDSDSRLIKDAKKAIKHLKYLDKKSKGSLLTIDHKNFVHLLTDDDKQKLAKIIAEESKIF